MNETCWMPQSDSHAHNFLLILPSIILIVEDKFQNRHDTSLRLRNGPEFQPAVGVFTEFDPVH